MNNDDIEFRRTALANNLGLVAVRFALAAHWALALACQNRDPSSASAVAAPSQSTQPARPVASPSHTSRHTEDEPVTHAAILRRLADTAAKVPSDAVVPRVGLADVAYPRSQDELKAMGGFALLLITVVCRDPNELPVSRVEIHAKEEVLDLPVVASRLGELQEGAAPIVFGRARYDGVYLLPVFMTRRHATVTVALSGNSSTLTVLRYPSDPEADGLPPGLDFNWKPFQPSAPAIHRLIDEELPLLAGVKLIGESP